MSIFTSYFSLFSISFFYTKNKCRLSNNQITYEGVLILFDYLLNNKDNIGNDIEIINLSNNNIDVDKCLNSGICCEIIFNCKKLKLLSFNNNHDIADSSIENLILWIDGMLLSSENELASRKEPI